MPSESDNYYENSAPPADRSATEQAPDETREDSGSPDTVVLPKSAFGGEKLSIGQICKFKIDRILEDEVTAKRLPYDESDQEESESTPDDESAEGEASAPAPAPEDMGNYS